MWSTFALAAVSTVDFVNYTDQTSTGTNMPRTSWKTMGGYPLCLPPEALARAFQSVTSPIMGRIVANVHSNRTLEALRDALLTKLISGTVRLRSKIGAHVHEAPATYRE